MAHFFIKAQRTESNADTLVLRTTPLARGELIAVRFARHHIPGFWGHINVASGREHNHCSLLSK